MQSKSNVIAALMLILVGLLFLANNLGWTQLSLGHLIATWWPALLVAMGIGMLFNKGK
ncbi:MAG TPA: LiaI-LiaF-like domain-containing protein [Xylella sp.]